MRRPPSNPNGHRSRAGASRLNLICLSLDLQPSQQGRAQRPCRGTAQHGPPPAAAPPQRRERPTGPAKHAADCAPCRLPPSFPIQHLLSTLRPRPSRARAPPHLCAAAPYAPPAPRARAPLPNESCPGSLFRHVCVRACVYDCCPCARLHFTGARQRRGLSAFIASSACRRRHARATPARARAAARLATPATPFRAPTPAPLF